MLSFSIVTCTWNSEPYLAQCIDSVASQLHPLTEQVFVDGGSEDGSLERIQGAQHRSQWVTGVRGGISNAMNEGVKLARGDVVAHLHGDDYYLAPDVLSRVAEALERSGADWLFGRIISDIEGSRVEPGWKMPVYSPNQLLAGNFIAHPATFIKRDLFLKARGFDTSLRYAMDYDLWLRLAKISPPYYLDGYLAGFRRHAGSVSTANAPAAFEEDHLVRRRYLTGANALKNARHELVHIWRRWRYFSSSIRR